MSIAFITAALRRVAAAAAAAAAALLLSATVHAADPAPEGGKAPTYTMNIANVADDSHPINIALVQFQRNVQQATHGDLQVLIHHSSARGGENEIIEKVNSGELEAAMPMSGSFWEKYNPAANVSLIPFLFTSLVGARRAWDGSFGAKFAREIIEPNGAYVLSYWESGYRHMTNSDHPITTPSDMAGIRFRTSFNDMKIQMFQALEADVVMMQFAEVYDALKSGAVGGQENPAANIMASDLYEVQKYLSLTGHMYDNCVFAVNRKWFDALPLSYQRILKYEARQARAIDLSLSDETRFIERLKELGMEVNEVDRSAFQQAMKPIWERFSREHGPEWIEAAVNAQM